MSFITQGKTNWKYISIILVLSFIVSIGILLWETKQKIPLVELPEVGKTKKENITLTLEKLKNAEYYTTTYEETVQLEDGFYFRPWLSDSVTGLEVKILNDQIAFGDLNNDGKEDAAVVLYNSGGGTGVFRDLAIMINENGKPSYLTSKSLGDRVIINSITMQSGIIILDMVVHGPEDGLCCPSVEKIFKYELSDNQLLEVVEDKTADWNIYRNEKYGFEIKYPKEWYQDKKESSYLYEKVFDIIRFSPNEEFLGWSDKEGLIKIDIISDFDEDLQIWFNKLSAPCMECAPSPPSFDSYTTIDGEMAIKAIEGTVIGQIDVFCTKDNIRYDFILLLPDTKDEFLINDYKNIFNQILSTFKFLE